MKLRKIRLKNIRSYEQAEIDFPEASTLLSGDIGSGKTSILLAIEYALFGLQPGQKGSALLRNNARSGEVTLELEIDGNAVVIERRLKRESKSVSNEYSAITINGEKREYSVTELKTKILSLLHYPSEFIKKNNLLYRYTVYTPQEQMKQIITEDPEIRLNILGYVFGIDKYKRIRENLTLLLNRLKEESKLLQGAIKDLDTEKSRLESAKHLLIDLQFKIEKRGLELKDNISRRQTREKELTELEKKIKEKENFEKEIEKTQIMVASKKDNINMLEREASALAKNLQGDILFDENKFNEIVKALAAKREELDQLNSKHIEFSSRINNFEQNKLLIQGKKDRVFQLEICPSCLQNVPHAHKHNILNETERELKEITDTLLSLNVEKEATKKLLESARLQLPKLEEEKTKMEIQKSRIAYIEKSRKRMEEIDHLKKTLDKDIILLTSHLNTLKESILEFSKFNNFFRIANEELIKALNAEKSSEIALAELNKELELTNNEIRRIVTVIEDKEKLKDKLVSLLELNDWLSGNFLSVVNYMERNVMIKLRVEFAGLFNKWFHILAGESFDVHLDENFTPLIVQGESEMDYAFLSGGERTAVALAYRLALNQTINSILSNIKTKDIIILDEPTEGFSDVQLDKMRDVLADLNIPQLIIVSHEQKIEGFVEEVIRLRKEGNLSSIDAAQTNQKP